MSYMLEIDGRTHGKVQFGDEENGLSSQMKQV